MPPAAAAPVRNFDGNGQKGPCALRQPAAASDRNITANAGDGTRAHPRNPKAATAEAAANMYTPLAGTVGVGGNDHHRNDGYEVGYRRDEADLKVCPARKAAHDLWQPHRLSAYWPNETLRNTRRPICHTTPLERA